MNILGIGSHYDDLELGCSGTLIKHVQAGDRVTMLVITDSAYRNPKGEQIRDADVAREEGEKAAAVIGGELICLEYPTLEVPFNDELTKSILGVIEEREIDTVYSHWTGDLHRDHQYAARSAMMAGRHVPRYLMYRSNYYNSDQTFRGNFYSDVTDVMHLKMDVIRAHVSELERVRRTWLTFFMHQNANDGQVIGVEYAEAFEIVRYLI